MKTNYKISVLALIAATVLSGCANTSPEQTSTPYYSPSSQSNNNNSSYGAIESIQMTRQEHASSGTGAVVGGLVGALLGNQVGSGSGRTAATVAGAVGGAVVGNNVEQNKNSQAQNMYQIQVHLDNGDSISIVQESISDLRVGNRVRVIDGRVFRY